MLWSSVLQHALWCALQCVCSVLQGHLQKNTTKQTKWYHITHKSTPTIPTPQQNPKKTGRYADYKALRQPRNCLIHLGFEFRWRDSTSKSPPSSCVLKGLANHSSKSSFVSNTSGSRKLSRLFPKDI